MAKAKTVELSIHSYDPKTGSIAGSTSIREIYDSVADALTASHGRIAPNMAVIIRPNYNEKTPEGVKFFREWRAMNGEYFKECRWEI